MRDEESLNSHTSSLHSSRKSRPPPSSSREAASAWIAAAIAAAALRAARLELILQRLPLLLRQQRPLAGEHLQLPIKDRVAHLPHAIPGFSLSSSERRSRSETPASRSSFSSSSPCSFEIFSSAAT